MASLPAVVNISVRGIDRLQVKFQSPAMLDGKFLWFIVNCDVQIKSEK